MDIYETWKVYKAKMEEHIGKFNAHVKEANFDEMRKAKDSTKNVYLKFL